MNLGSVREWPRSTQVVAVALMVSLLLDVALATRLLRPQNDNITFEPLRIQGAPRIIARTSDGAELVREAENRAPFGGTAAVNTQIAPVVQQAALVRAPRLVGTVVEGHGGFVVLEMPDGHMQVVRIGERAGDLLLRSISVGQAAFDDRAGTRITLRSPAAGTETRP
ncbi:MAG: hypothetical protein ABJE10_00280 [bacterium]